MTARADVEDRGALIVSDAVPARPRTAAGKILGCLKLAARLARDRRGSTDPIEDLRIRALRMQEVSQGACAIHGLDIRVRGSMPSETGIIVGNHMSFIDPLILGTLRPCSPVAKSEVGDWPVVGAAGDRMGAMYVRRADTMSGACVLLRARRLLDNGISVLNFPEGTTTDGTSLAPFKRGMFGLAQKLDVPIYPVHLSIPKALLWVGDDYFLPTYMRFARRPRTEVVLNLGAPIAPTAAPDAEALAALTRTRIVALGQR